MLDDLFCWYLFDLLEAIQQQSAIKTAGADTHNELLLEELLQNTWFTTPSRRHLTESLAGTRPGDGLADVVFSFVFHRLLDKVHQELHELQQWTQVIRGEDVDIKCEPEVSQHIPPMVEVVWADDLAFAINAESATEAICRVRTVAQHLIQKCLQHGMQPNMARNKTEIMLHLRGTGSRQAKRDLYNCDSPALHIDGVPTAYADIKLTGAYKHLGHRLHLGDAILAEIKMRTGQALSVYRQYRRLVFQNPRLPLEKRRYLFQSLVLSILRYNMGTWPRLSGKCWTVFQSKVMAMYRGLVRTTIKEQDLRYWNNDKVLSFLELPSPSTLLHDARLRYSLSLIRSGPQHLWCLLVAEKEWLGLLVGYSRNWLDTVLTDKAINLHQTGISGSENNLRPSRDGSARQCDMIFYNIIFAHNGMSGITISFWSAKRVVYKSISLGRHWKRMRNHLLNSWMHAYVAQGFSEGVLHGLFMPSKKHGRINWRREYISDSRCEACMKDFTTPTRLLHHLNYNKNCSDVIRRNLDKVEVQPGRNSRREAKDALLQIPVIRAEGPTQAWMLNGQYDTDPDLDQDFIVQLQDCVDAIQEHSQPDEAVMVFKRAFLCSNNSFQTLCYTFRWFLPNAIPDSEDPRTRRQRMTLQMVQDQLRLRWFFHEDDIAQAGPLPSAEDLRGNAWKFCDVDRQNKRWTITRHDPRNGFSDFAVVHLFAGERRTGDLESFLETIKLPPRAVRVIISVDIIYDRKNADLSKHDVQQTWLGFISRGLVAVLYTGPPCETWSSARALGGIAGYTNGDNGPRMVRTSEKPFGLPGLRLREARQVLVANILLTFSLLAMLFMLKAQRLAVLEHPSQPDDAWKPSIWRLHVVSILLAHERVRLHHIQQGRFGGHSPKPTSLLIVAHTAIERSLRRFAITPLPKAVEMGKKGGEYGTAKLKNYPPLLCESLSNMAEEWAFANFEVPAIEKSDIDFLAYVAHLRCGYNLSACRGQDYASN